jgi:hypothetical protein
VMLEEELFGSCWRRDTGSILVKLESGNIDETSLTLEYIPP